MKRGLGSPSTREVSPASKARPRFPAARHSTLPLRWLVALMALLCALASEARADQGAERTDEAHPAEDPMPWASLAVRVGVAQVRAGKINNPAYRRKIAEQAAMLPPDVLARTGYLNGAGCTLIDRTCQTEGRFGFHIVAALHLGGDGFGWDLEPYLTLGGTSQAYGGYTGPKFDIHVARRLYLGFGFGVRAAYVLADGWRYGADIGGRIPFHAVMYVEDNFALELDFGMGVGAAGYLSTPVHVTNPVTGAPVGSAPRMTFGLARAWDLSLGLRFP